MFQHAYELVSLERMLAEASPGLADWPPDNRVLAAFRLQTAPTPAALLRQLEREYANFPGPGDVDTRRVLHAWAGALLATIPREAATKADRHRPDHGLDIRPAGA